MIITIGRECGCGADEIGKMLSEKYQLPCYMKSNIIAYAKEKGLYDRFPYFFGEVPIDFLMSSLDENIMERVRNTPREAFGKLMEDQDCIIIGRTSNYAFRNREDSVRIFLCADIIYRIAKIEKTHSVSTQKAQKIVEETGGKRRRYHQYYTGEEWGYAGNYDLCLDVSALGMQGIMEVIGTYIKYREEEKN